MTYCIDWHTYSQVQSCKARLLAHALHTRPKQRACPSCCLQASVLKRIAFVRKQHAIRDAVRIGDQIIRRKRRMLLAGTFNAWKLRAGIYRQVARRFQASLQLTLRWAWTQWKAQLATQVLIRLSSGLGLLPCSVCQAGSS